MVQRESVKTIIETKYNGLTLHDDWLQECMDYLEEEEKARGRSLETLFTPETIASSVFEQLLLTDLKSQTNSDADAVSVSVSDSDNFIVDSILKGGNSITSVRPGIPILLQVLAVRNVGSSLYNQHLALDNDNSNSFHREIIVESDENSAAAANSSINESTNSSSTAPTNLDKLENDRRASRRNRCLWFLLTDGKVTINAIETSPISQTIPEYPPFGFKLLYMSDRPATLVSLPKSFSNGRNGSNSDPNASLPFLLIDPSNCKGLGGDVISPGKETGKSWALSEIHRLVPELGTRYRDKMTSKRQGSNNGTNLSPMNQQENSHANNDVAKGNMDSIVLVPDDDDFNWDLIQSP